MHNKATIDAYNKYAELYDQEVIEFWDNFPREFITKFVDNAPGGRVLNLGSGSGRDAVLLRDLGLDVVCVDGSASMVEITKKLGFESHLAEFSQIDFVETSFDGVWAYTSLIHVPVGEARQVISKIRTLLKTSGVLAFGAIEGEEAGMRERKTMPGVERYFKNYTKQEAKELIEPLGFKLVYESDYRPHSNIYINQLYTCINV